MRYTKMRDPEWLNRQAQITLARLLPRLEPLFHNTTDYETFSRRLYRHLPQALNHLMNVYGDHYDFFYHLEQILRTAAHAYIERSADLRTLDEQREADLLWFKRENMVGGVCYVDLFAGDLNGVREKIPYFQELGLTYLHLMPLFEAPAENSDGGYAISSFRRVNGALGVMDDLAALATELREAGISLVIDFVFNHTSDEHEWALRALDGEERYQDFYYIFPDRRMPDAYEENLREIFPEQAPGNFTYRGELDSWVWTTFNNFQWDLNYSNPDVFNAMLGEMLFLANQGTEILRLDAVAFVWKQMGTTCENLPQVHDIIRAFNALVKVVAPAMLFKSEAIVHPDDVASYIDWDECPISYNPTYMALLWEALATREVQLLRHSMARRWNIDPRSTWINYIRVHDDIGWSFADEDASELGINGFDHRQFLNQFYTGQFAGSFATGLGFNFNPQTLDMRICGTTASLAGLEQGLKYSNDGLIGNAQKRIAMLHAVMIGAGGIPLIYLGDEIATQNDYSFRQIPGKANDERWVHRPHFDWERAEKRTDPSTPEGFVFGEMLKMIAAKKHNPLLSDEYTVFFDNKNPHVLSFVRNRAVLVMANFSEKPQQIHSDWIKFYWSIPPKTVDLITGETFETSALFTLEPYQYLWLVDATHGDIAPAPLED